MTQNSTTAKQAALVQEFAAELTPSAEELAAMLGPSSKKGAGMDSGRAPEASDAGAVPRNMQMIMNIPVSVKIVLGSATMPVAGLVNIARGAVIPLDRKVGEPVDVVVNGRVIARGEVVVIDEAESRFGVSLTEVVGPGVHSKPL